MAAKPPRSVACPRCGKQAFFSPDNLFRPFCSERCRLIDLGAWANESYRVPDTTPPDPADETKDQ